MKKLSWWVLAILVAASLPSCSTVHQGDLAHPRPGMLSGTPPKDAQNLWQQAENDRKAGKISSTISTLEYIAQTYPDNVIAARAFHALGNIYLEENQPDRALEYLNYLIYVYPQWDGIHMAKVDQLRALWKKGKRKQVQKEALTLWEVASANPEAQVHLSLLMVEVYREAGEIETGFDWASAGFSKVRDKEQERELARATIALLEGAKESTVQKLLEQSPKETMRLFVEYRLAQLEMERSPSKATRERLNMLLAQNPTHPLVSEIRALLREVPADETLPLHADRIGCLVPIDGPYGKYGELILRGITLAMEDWNRVHYDQRVSVIVKDTKAEPATTAKSFEELAKNDGVLAVVGPLGIQSAKAVFPLADKWNIPVLAFTQKDEENISSPFVIHTFLDNREMVRALVKFCRERLGYSRFATLYPDDRYGNKLSKIFAEAVQESGGTLLAGVSYKEKSTDFKEPILKLIEEAKKNSPATSLDTTPFEALFLPDQVQTVSLIAPQLPYYNIIGTTLLGTNLWGEAPLAQAGGVYVENAIYATPFFPENRDPRIQEFRDKYQSIYSTSPSYLEAQAYDAMMLLLEARYMASSSYLERASLLQSLLSIRDHAGLTGNASLTHEGDLERDYVIVQILNGQPMQLFP